MTSLSPMPAPDARLHIAALRKSVPGGRVLFSGLALDVAPGELVAIMGESGSGKSTLLNLIAGLDRPDSGDVVIAGTRLGGLDERGLTELRRARIGFVFQAFHILPYLTLRRNVALPLAIARIEAFSAELAHASAPPSVEPTASAAAAPPMAPAPRTAAAAVPTLALAPLNHARRAGEL